MPDTPTGVDGTPMAHHPQPVAGLRSRLTRGLAESLAIRRRFATTRPLNLADEEEVSGSSPGSPIAEKPCTDLVSVFAGDCRAAAETGLWKETGKKRPALRRFPQSVLKAEGRQHRRVTCRVQSRVLIRRLSSCLLALDFRT